MADSRKTKVSSRHSAQTKRQPRSLFAAGVFGVLAVALVGLAVPVLRHEVRIITEVVDGDFAALFGVGNSAVTTRAAWRNPDIGPCLDETQRLIRNFQLDEGRALRRTCLEAVDKSLAEAPRDGEAWLWRAILDWRINGYSRTVAESLEASHRFAPYEGWIIRRRVVFALRVLDDLPDTARNNVARDIQMMATGRAYVERLANIYLASTDDRQAFITVALEGAPERNQERFVGAMRRALNDIESQPAPSNS